VRVYLDYDVPDRDAPATIIVKLSTTDQDILPIIARYGLYEREVRFYQEVANQIKMRTPQCYCSMLDEAGEQFVLLLEDMAPARVGDQVAGCSPAEAELAIIALAKLHAAYWGSPLLQEMAWAPTVDGPEQMNQETYQQHFLPRYLEKWESQASPQIVAVGEGHGKLIPLIAKQMRGQCAKTLVHGDYRLDNLFFNQASVETPFAVVDWQMVKQGSGLCDVAYFLSGNLEVGLRRQAETKLLTLYHQTLLGQGVRNYPFEQCLADYRLSLFCVVNTNIEVGATLNITTERAADLWRVIVERLTAVLQDHNILGLLAELA
jgi:hypothetical protein